MADPNFGSLLHRRIEKAETGSSVRGRANANKRRNGERVQNGSGLRAGPA